ncbi:putative tellurite resistance protein B-like protein [Clostridium beijerinckii]|uniref:hypothetical protein n=1 Tax=Clostridium beijerinckii TaxID=1520 RepID=UPI0015CE8563|nr:hypothetical protein [Clostridium beijerinckii]NYC75623.1 putative tellurite resistance protein B-like protein [Clostridium beijerinckii]
MEKVRIGYSSSREIKDYLEFLAEKYNMTVSGVLTMIVMQHKFQNETLDKFNQMQDIISKMPLDENGRIILPKQPSN